MDEPEHYRTGIFESVKSMALTPSWVLTILLLEKRENINQAIEFYNVTKLKGFSADVFVIQGRINSLWLDIKASYEDSFKKKEEAQKKIKELDKLINTNEFNDLSQAYDIINRFLYDKGVTKFDLNKIYDDTNIITSNQRKGYS